jgi:NAD-dependent dihydropyrimidine dehydrogenase PreA subunit
MAKNWYPIINKETCMECGKCIKKCAHGVYDKNSPLNPVVIFPDGCVNKCHGCGNICPSGSITYKGDDTGWTPPNENKADCCKDKPKSKCC